MHGFTCPLTCKGNDADGRAMIAALQSGKADAVVADGSFVDYHAAQECSLAVVPGTFSLWDLAIGYSQRLPREVVTAIDVVILEAQQKDSMLDNTKLRYITQYAGSCADAVEDEGVQVTMLQVRGSLVSIYSCMK